MSMNKIKVRYISEKESVYFRKGEIYEAYYPLDDKSKKYLVFSLPDMEEPGDYALPASRFEVVSGVESM